jgi:hypothetical protein
MLFRARSRRSKLTPPSPPQSRRTVQPIPPDLEALVLQIDNRVRRTMPWFDKWYEALDD